MLEAGINVNTKTVNGVNCLLALADRKRIHGHFLAITKLLIESKIDLNTKEGKEGNNILISLLQNFSKQTLEIVRFLTKHEIEVNAINKSGFNALLSLAKTRTVLTPTENRDFTEIFKILLQKSIDITQKNSDGMNVLHLLW